MVLGASLRGPRQQAAGARVEHRLEERAPPLPRRMHAPLLRRGRGTRAAGTRLAPGRGAGDGCSRRAGDDWRDGSRKPTRWVRLQQARSGRLARRQQTRWVANAPILRRQPLVTNVRHPRHALRPQGRLSMRGMRDCMRGCMLGGMLSGGMLGGVLGGVQVGVLSGVLGGELCSVGSEACVIDHVRIDR